MVAAVAISKNVEVSVAKLNKANLKKTLYYLQRNGLRETWISVRERLTETDRYFFVPCSEEELEKQSDRKWDNLITFSILVPLYRTPETYLKRMITSVMVQSYPHWELILADATEDRSVEETLRQQGFLKEQPTDGETEPVAADPRIRYVHLKENAGIAANTNQALPYAKGAYIGLLDHDDVLTPDALYEMADAVTKAYDRGVKVTFAYSDEDKCDGEETRYYDPNHKENFNYDLILSNNYICHFLVMDAELMKRLQFRPECDGAQDYDLVLRAVAEVLAADGRPGRRAFFIFPRCCITGDVTRHPRQPIPTAKNTLTRRDFGLCGIMPHCGGSLQLPVRPGMWDFIVYSIQMYYRTARMWQPWGAEYCPGRLARSSAAE